MSEYQYYEFLAIDQPLTQAQQNELRGYSTRASITSNRFVNEYHWGDFKGNQKKWMVDYFDVHVHYASWGSSCLMLSLPMGSVDKPMLSACCEPTQSLNRSNCLDCFETKSTAGYDVLMWHFYDEDANYYGYWDEGQSELIERLSPLRDELLSGDSRPLYLGWLARVCAGELTENDLEPPLPEGLGELTSAQHALVEFIHIDPDWLAAAAMVSPPRQAIDPEAPQQWLSLQSEKELKRLVQLLLSGCGKEAERDALKRYNAWLAEQQAPEASPPRRTVAQIEAGKKEAREQRLAHEEKLAKAAAAIAAAERAEYLTKLAEHSEREVKKIEVALQKGSGKGYDLARDLFVELHEALRHTHREQDLQQIMEKLMSTHGRRRSWVARLKAAGLSITV